MSTNGMSVTLTASFTDTVNRTRTELAAQGFGVLTEIDVAATMKAKLGLDMAPYLILGACNPLLAHQAITADPSIGLLLPCNVVVRSLNDTGILVEAMDPDVIVTATGNPDLAPFAAQARTLLSAALADLTSGELDE